MAANGAGCTGKSIVVRMITRGLVHYNKSIFSMGDKARAIQSEYLKTLPDNKRLFPINAGMGWVGNIVRKSGGVVIISNPRPLHAAPTGWPDLCGWETIEITPKMIGWEIAVFCGVEIKADGDKLTKEQKNFATLIENMGGIYRVITESSVHNIE